MSTTNKDFKVKNGLTVADGGTFGGPVAVGAPQGPDDATTKSYVDAIAYVTGPTGPSGVYTASSAPPENPEPGDSWLNSDTLSLYVFYDGFWVEVTGDLGPTGPTGPAPDTSVFATNLNPTFTINSQYNSLVTDYLMSYFISASGNDRTMSFGSWTVMLNSTSLVAGDKVLLFLNSGVASTSEPVTVVSFNLNNSQVTLTSTNPAVLLELEAQNIVGGQAYKVIDQSSSITPQNLLRLSNLLNAPKIPANSSTLTAGRYFVPSSIDPYSLTLPANPELGDEIQIFDSGNYAGTQNITINRNGQKINGISDNALLDVNGVAATFVYTGSTYGWRMG